MISFDQLKYKEGQKLWDYKSQQWLTLEKTAVLSKIEYLQFKEIDNIVRYKDYDLYFTEIRK
jgi:hypothetical protein